MRINTNHRGGLSFLEVAVILVTVVLVVGFLWPLFHRPRPTNRGRIRCVNNLKQVGLAFRLYANDHGDQFSFRVSNEFAGTIDFVNSPQVFRHYQAMSNELNTPKILVCPSDPQRFRATNFLGSFGNSNISYFVGLDADETEPERLLSGDRNITGGRLSNGFLRVLRTNSLAGWTATIHTNAGNIGLADGSVQQMMPATLRRQLQMQTFNDIRLAIP
ncbi:MAG TPA: type II secretion system protein [Methylomirabilota bacterium]|nr:type II secretion system protein [Methylomirabilota bacterium]